MDFKNLGQGPSTPIIETPQLGTSQDEKVWNGVAWGCFVILGVIGIWILIEANQKPSRHRSRSGIPYSEDEERKMEIDRNIIRE
jgi:hypothetical protein